MLKRLFLSSLFSALFQDRPVLLMLWTEEPERASSSFLRSTELISRLTFIKIEKMSRWVSEKKQLLGNLIRLSEIGYVSL